METKKVVIEFFEKNSSIPASIDEDSLHDLPYLDFNLIDSMGIILMITEFEEKFGIEFTPSDLQSYEFQTINGLINIINKKLEN